MKRNEKKVGIKKLRKKYKKKNFGDLWGYNRGKMFEVKRKKKIEDWEEKNGEDLEKV